MPLVFSCKKTEESPIESGINLYFERLQPINDSEINKIPNKFRGLYINADSVFLRINENTIFREGYYKTKIHKKLLDTIKNGIIFSGNKLFMKDTKIVYDVTKEGDSLVLTNKYSDTIFNLSNVQKAKRINGQLVLNVQDSIFWKVKFLSIEKEILKIREIYSEEDLKRIDSITKIKSKSIDSLSYLLKPSRKEFKKILNLKKIGFERQYKRV